MIDTQPFDPLAASADEWERLHAYRRARGAEDYAGDPRMADAEFERALRLPDPLIETRRIMAVRDGEFVGNLIGLRT